MAAQTNLRMANVLRHAEWSVGGDDGEFYAIELFGEAGECLNVIKKLERERLGMVGSRATVEDLANELADTLICIDLLAIAYRLPLIIPGRGPIDASAKSFAVTLGSEIGAAMTCVEEIEATGTYTPRWVYEELRKSLEQAAGVIVALSHHYQFDLRSAVVAKFNKTSVKYGLHTRMDAAASIF